MRSDAVDTHLQALWALMYGVVALVLDHPGFPFVPRDRLIDRTLVWSSPVSALARGVSPQGRAGLPRRGLPRGMAHFWQGGAK